MSSPKCSSIDSAGSPFDNLPNELLVMVKDAIDDDDLLTHVCFRNLSRRMASLYDTEDAAFWERLCRMNGIGLLGYENATEY